MKRIDGDGRCVNCGAPRSGHCGYCGCGGGRAELKERMSVGAMIAAATLKAMSDNLPRGWQKEASDG